MVKRKSRKTFDIVPAKSAFFFFLICFGRGMLQLGGPHWVRAE